MPSNTEHKRLRALQELEILDSPPEAEFDALVKAAAIACGVPISLISLVDRERQWFKANWGLEGVTETSRSVSFCTHAIEGEGCFEIPDATSDPRFANNELVIGAPNIRFYAGIPLQLNNGEQVGTLCIIDDKPRELTQDQRSILTHLSTAAVRALESRRMARGFLASEARFRALSDASPLGVFATDTAGACTYTNSRWQQIFDLSPDQAIGHGWSQTLHRDDKEAVFNEWQRTANLALDFDMDFRIRHHDGTILHVRAVAKRIVDEKDRVSGFVGSVEDVSVRRAQEKALQKSESLLSRTGALAQVGGWELDLLNGTLIWSDQTCLIHGVEPGYQPHLDEAISFYAPEAQAIVRAAIEKSMGDGTDWDLELPFTQISGQQIWVRAIGQTEVQNGNPVRLLGTFQDITERVEQRKALEKAHERMTLAADSGGIGIWEFDLKSGVMEMDPQMRHLYAVPQDAKTGLSAWWSKRLHPEDATRVMGAMKNALNNKEAYTDEFRIVLPDASVRHLRAAAHTTQGQNGEVQLLVGVNSDVTALRELSTELADQRELLEVTLQSIGDAVITTDAAGHVTWLNPAAERMTGWLSKQAVDHELGQVFNIVNEQTLEPAQNPVIACLAEGKIVGLANHTILISRDGTRYGIEDSAAPIRNARGEVLGAVLVFHDVTEQRRLSGEMTYRATHDSLTGLVNRTEFETRLRRILDKAHADGSKHALMYIDLDQFKLINDACGHAIGDQLLLKVANMLRDVVRSRDTLARLGGDEFAVILEHCTSDKALRLAQQICDQMDDFRFIHDDRSFRIGASIGLVSLDQRWSEVTALMQAADTSCYAAKEAGRNRVHHWFDTDQIVRARQGEMQWASRLEQAIDENRFVLYAQRIKPITDGSSALHAEVLIRLRDTDGSLIQPGAFLPAAERFHLASRIDRWVLRHVVDHLLELPSLSTVQMLCVNLSGQSVGDRAFHRDAIDLLTRAGPAVCKRLCLEITETAAVTALADAAIFIEKIHLLGVQVALDDFGAGASSFGYLKNLNVDVIKIDGQFIKNLVSDQLDMATVRCFVEVAKVVEIKTVAEYVDQPEILERVRELGIDYAQGFLIHQPEPINQVLGLQSQLQQKVR